MITFQRELLYDIKDEVQPLLEKHHAEVGFKGRPLSPRWDAILWAEGAGNACTYTARDDAEIVAYSGFLTDWNLLYSDLMMATNLAFYVKPSHRSGITVLRFLRFCHDDLKAEGAEHVIYHCKTINNLAPLLHRLGFEDDEKTVGGPL